MIHVRTQKGKGYKPAEDQVINIMVFQNLIYQLENNLSQNPYPILYKSLCRNID